MWKDFKEFIAQGNVLDLAIGIMIGASFGNIVSSLVDNIMMPTVGLILGGIDFTSLQWKIGDSIIGYGIFIQHIVDFFIIAFSIFIFIRLISKVKKKKEMNEEEVVIDENTQLLIEIRDLLKNR